MTHFRFYEFRQILFRATVSALLLLAILYGLFFSSAVTGWLKPVLFTLAGLTFVFFNRRSTGLELPGMAFLAVLWIAGAVGLDPRRSFEMLWGFSAGFFFIFFAASLTRVVSPARMVALLLAAGGIYMAWAWVDAAGWYARWLQAAPGQWLPEIPFRLNGSNNVAAYLNLLLFTTLGASFSLPCPRSSSPLIKGGRGGFVFLFLSLYALSAAALLFLSNSRGGWVGTAVGLAAFLILFAFHRGPGLRQAALRLLHSRRFWLAVAALGLVAVALVWFYLARMANHPTHGSRLDFWLVGLQAFLHSPLLGNGPNTYVIFHMQANSYPPTGAYFHSHNQYIEILAASGLIGATAFLGFLYALARRGLHIWQSLDRTPTRWLFIGATAALAAYLAHGIFDGLYRMPWAGLTLVVLLGAFTAQPLSSDPGRAQFQVRALKNELTGRFSFLAKLRRMALFSLLPLLLLACAAAGLFNAWRTEPYLAGVKAAAAGDLSSAAGLFTEATRRDPTFTPTYTQLGLVQAQRAGVTDAGLLEASAAAFEQATWTDPSWALNYAQLCAVRAAVGRLSQAECACQAAVTVAPGEPLFWLNLALVQEKFGVDPSAAFRQVLALAPQTRTAAFWQANPARQTVLAEFKLENPAAPDRPLSIAGLEALTASGAGSAADFLALAQSYRLAGHLAEAGAAIRKSSLAFSFPADVPERLWQQAELAAERGDLAQAASLHRNAAGLVLHPGLYGPQSSGQAAYLSQAFFVPVLPTDFVPQMAQLPLSAEWQLRLDGIQDR